MVQYYSNTFLTPKNINTFQIISEHFLRSARSVFGFRTNRDGQDGQDGRGISNTQTSSNDDNINRSRGHVGFLFRVNAPFSRSFVPPPICHISTFKVSFSYMCFLFYSWLFTDYLLQCHCCQRTGKRQRTDTRTGNKGDGLERVGETHLGAFLFSFSFSISSNYYYIRISLPVWEPWWPCHHHHHQSFKPTPIHWDGTLNGWPHSSKTASTSNTDQGAQTMVNWSLVFDFFSLLLCLLTARYL